jgi:hypothetical protein
MRSTDSELPTQAYVSSSVSAVKSGQHFHIPIELVGKNCTQKIAAMVDCGASSPFLSERFVKQHHVLTKPLPSPITLYNIDMTKNKAGTITHSAELEVRTGAHREKLRFLVTDVGPEDVVLGITWLRDHNPEIDWTAGKLNFTRCTCPGSSQDANPPEVPIESGESELAEPELIASNRTTRRAWLKAGILEHATDALYAAAGYTYSQKVAEDAGRVKRERSFEEIVPEHYRHFSKVFSDAKSERLPEHQPWDHTIDLKEGAPETVRAKVYPMPPNEQQELDAFLEDNLRKGYITPSKSPMASPVFFIKKKDGKLRLVQDYRKLNDITIKNRYPLPLPADIINRLSGAKYFSKFDVRWGYTNVRIKEGDEWKAAFTTSRGLFEPRVMFFGLTNSPATFQALMNTIFADLIAKGRVAVYLDDILVFSMDLEQHRRDVNEVLRRLEAHDLYLRPEKCEFEQTEVEYLGMIISEGSVRMDDAKVQAVSEWPTPRNLRDVRSFVGFANFYRRFIQDFSKIVRPLHDLTKKDVPFSWGTAQKLAFDTLKKAFVSKPILALWEPHRRTRLEVDASGYATGGVISQEGDDGLWHPVAFRSESLIEAERNYQTWDREMLAIIRALEEWRHYLEGLPQPFEILTDHNNLTFWTTAQNLSRRQARWALWLSRFDFTLTHKPGKANTLADALSRRADHETGDADDNQGVVALGPEHFRAAATTALVDPTALTERIRNGVRKEAMVLAALDELRKRGPRKLTDGTLEWEELDGLVYYRGRLYVPDDKGLRQEVVHQCHDAPTAGHHGRDGTLELVSRHYWWPSMSSFVAKYVAGCDTCQRRKAGLHPEAPTEPLDVPDGPWQVVGVDLVTGLPESNGYDTICTIVDHYTHVVHAVPCKSTIGAEGVAEIYVREVFRLHGIPGRFVTDRGPQFAARIMREFLRLLGIDAGLTTAYHPQANGMTERMNAEVVKYLRLFCDQRQDNWAPLLPMAEFVINSREVTALKNTPFEVQYGYRPNFTIPAGRSTPFPSVAQRLEHLREAHKDAEAAMRMAKEHLRSDNDVRARRSHMFTEVDKVWLDAKDIKVHQPSKKLGPKRLGPFTVVKRVGDLDYQLALPPSLKLHDVFHVDRLSPWKGNEVNGELPPPPGPIEIDDEEEYEVEAILDSRFFRRRLQYLVQWKGYDAGHNMWIPWFNVNSEELVNAFHRRNPNAVKRISVELDSVRHR